MVTSATTCSAWELPSSDPPRVADVGFGWRVDPDMDEWLLPDLWQLHLYGYHADFDVGAYRLEVAPGTVSVVPPGMTIRHHYRGDSRHLYAHFAFSARPSGHQSNALRRVPVVTQLSPGPTGNLSSFRSLFEEAISGREADPVRARAAVWLILTRLASELDRDHARPPIHPVVQAAIDLVDRNLSDDLRVSTLAREVAASENHLARLFRSPCGTTVSRYVRRRRMERARYLLTHSTLQVKSVARVVGIPDLQSFNKVFRAHVGVSPRAFRAGEMSESGQLECEDLL